jgi:hypothetical protein
MEIDDIDGSAVGNSSGATNTTIATVTQPTWPVETDIVLSGTNKVKLSVQSHLLQGIFHGAFEIVRCDLIFEHAFPHAVAIPAVVRKALVRATEIHTTLDGHYNPSVACVHQRILSDDDYQAKMIHLVSGITSSMT